MTQNNANEVNVYDWGYTYSQLQIVVNSTKLPISYLVFVSDKQELMLGVWEGFDTLDVIESFRCEVMSRWDKS